MVSVDECMLYASDLINFGDIEWLAVRIGEAYEKHERGEKLTQQDRFVLGLRYSEFFARTTSDEAYIIAETKRQCLLKNLNISIEELNKAVFEVTGLR